MTSAVADRDVAQVRAELDELSAGTSGWMCRNASYLLPDSPEPLKVVPKVKASTELALLHRLWTRTRPDDPGLAIVSDAVRTIWQDPGVPRRVTTSPSHYRQFVLIYAGLAPAGLPTRHHLDALAVIAPDGHLQPYGTSPYLRLEARFYADMAGLRHDFESYRELYDGSVLARMTTVPDVVDIEDAYQVTHTLFHITDFGAHEADLDRAERDRALRIVEELTEHFVAIRHWDLTAELVLSQHCLGADPTATPSGAAGIRSLLAAQQPDGSLPARSAAQLPPDSASPVLRFRHSFHTTLVSTIMSLLVRSRPG